LSLWPDQGVVSAAIFIVEREAVHIERRGVDGGVLDGRTGGILNNVLRGEEE
jgi:hypothetical protein